jgi:hypothetical protein
MTVTEQSAGESSLKDLERELRSVVANSEKHIGALVQDFEGLAKEISQIIDSAGIIVGCAESKRMLSILSRVQLLGAAAKSFIEGRLAATKGILDTVTAEAALLERLAQQTCGQRAIVRETEMLRVLTNIEVARLGDVGTGFQYLAHELDDFSREVARSTNELSSQMEERRKAIEETRRTLTVELPRMRVELARMVADLDTDVGKLEEMLGQLVQTPVRFRACVERIAGEVAGVVAAVQGHDITRQQIEHVGETLAAMAAAQPRGQDADTNPAGFLPAELEAGLTIQSYQLRNARETVRTWMTQIRTCLDGIEGIASSEILELGPRMLEQEKGVSSQLMRIENLEQECEAGNAKVQASFAGINGLMELVGEHLARSKSVRDRLQLLMFNSIVEASRLGTRADAILEISTNIKRISAAWGGLTAQSESTAREIGTLVERSGTVFRAFSQGGKEGLRQALAETHEGMGILREAAECADGRGRAIQTATLALQKKIAEIGGTGDLLEACFGQLESTVDGIESARLEIAKENSRDEGRRDSNSLEKRFGSIYTTEIERVVLRAALAGGPLPTVQQNFAGNCVELF